MPGHGVTSKGVEWSLKDCASQSVSKMKNKNLKMTPAVAAGFRGPAVREYVGAIRGVQVPSSVVIAPHEFSDVLELGKEAVPFLLEQLASEDESIREAALQAL
jgi:hypothetical protein